MMSVLIVITAIVTTYYCGWVIYNLIGWTTKDVMDDNQAEVDYKLTVIVACRNEEENIITCLDGLLAQNYPADKLEILIVDDNSTDKTATIVQGYKRAKLIKSGGEGKKAAIITGIENATGQIIVTTDADCRFRKNWLKHINKKFNNPETQLLCGPVAYDNEKGFFQKFQSLDFCSMVAMAGGGIMAGFPNTCNAANFAYRKEVFYEVGGFKDNNGMPSGDDDFLMHKIHHKYKRGVKFLKEEEAIVYTLPQPNWRSFIEQRTRWASKSASYKHHWLTVTLVMAYFCYILLVVNTVLAFIYPVFIKVLIWQAAAKLFTEAAFFAVTLPFFKKQKLFWLLPQVEVLHTLYLIFVVIRGNFGKYTWKNRVVKK